MEQHTSRQAQSQLVSLNRDEQISYNSDDNLSGGLHLMIAHGSIMIFAWILIVPTGILVARYFKKIIFTKDRKLCGEAIWFAFHRLLMSTVAILTIVGFLFIFAYKQGSWTKRSSSTKSEFAHSITGIIIISFTFLQPIIALFRCHPESRYRFIYNGIHGFIGFSIFILSIVTLFLAMHFAQFVSFKKFGQGILIGWAIWVGLAFILFEFIEFLFITKKISAAELESRESETIRLKFAAMNSRTLPTIPVSNEKPKRTQLKDGLKIVLLVVHILVALSFTLALVIKLRKKY
ncbi:unnamed protein product [Didymodactylos carnosus]|nr:unnamed protein product [Didymodactylos carnosus]CAF4271375.1 unnamed protein product [Didymodactylos carnosus]